MDTILCPKRVSDCDCTLGNDTDRLPLFVLFLVVFVLFVVVFYSRNVYLC